MQTNPSDPAAAGPHNPQPWRLVGGLLALIVVLGGLVLLPRLSNVPSRSNGPQGAQRSETAGLENTRCEIDRGDSAAIKTQTVPWKEGLTVFEQLCRAAEVRATGEGYFTFVESIDGVRNEGAEGRNWQFWLNGERSDEGAGAMGLRPGDRVLWRFAGTE